MVCRSEVASMLVLLFVSGLTAALPPASAQASPSVVAVSIPSGAGSPNGTPGYSPDEVTVVIGVNSTVTWTNNDGSTHHTVTSSSVPAGASSFDSGDMAGGATFTYNFTTAGTYKYICSYHSWMSGTVIVEAASTSTSTKTAPEFPAAYLAMTLFAVIAAVVVAATRLRPTPSAGSAGATTSRRSA